ncbi:MAG: peroxiredoxin family protein [Flavobacteriaceae bacterium]
MKVQLLSHYQYSQKIVSFLIILFAFSSCVSDEITTEMIHSPEPDDEQTDDPTPPENPAPAFSLQTSTGEDINLSDYEGKVVTLFFFGHGCPPCRGVAPSVQDQLADPYSSNDDYAILGLDVWDGNSSSVDAFETVTEVNFPLLLNASSVARDYETTYDRIVVIDQNGGISFSGTQAVSSDLETAKTHIDSLLSGE